MNYNICVKLHLYPYYDEGRIVTLACIYESRVGQMARNMQFYYRLQTTKDLRVSRSKKLQQLAKLDRNLSWFDRNGRERLRRQIEWIEIELKSRELQMPLL